MKTTWPSLRFLSLCVFAATVMTWSSGALAQSENAAKSPDEIEELDPYAPNVEETLKAFDKAYEEQTGQSSHLPETLGPVAPTPEREIYGLYDDTFSCYRRSCPVYIEIDKTTQHAYFFVNGTLQGEWPVSTGLPGHSTPDFDRHPDGRIYDRYTSAKYPGGDYMGLGNMPYAVFIQGGFAIHGTPQGNWPKLGQRASHGCIRMHPDNAKIFNQHVRQAGIAGTWITVH